VGESAGRRFWRLYAGGRKEKERHNVPGKKIFSSPLR
jgi:hypothetical protein